MRQLKVRHGFFYILLIRLNVATLRFFALNNFQDANNDDDEDVIKELNDDKAEEVSKDKSTQIGHRDMREIAGDRIKESEAQTDIRMVHELAAPNRFLERDKPQKPTLASRTDSKYVQTDPSAHPTLSSQSSVRIQLLF